MSNNLPTQAPRVRTSERTIALQARTRAAYGAGDAIQVRTPRSPVEGSRPMQLSLLCPILLFAALLAGCTKSTTPTLQNHRPVIFSIRLFPSSINVNDSLLIVVNAYDPDADTLVYDWETDGRLHIQGARPGFLAVYNTYDNARTCYPIPSAIQDAVDTLWIKCYARDGRGMSDNRTVRFVVYQ